MNTITIGILKITNSTEFEIKVRFYPDPLSPHEIESVLSKDSSLNINLIKKFKLIKGQINNPSEDWNPTFSNYINPFEINPTINIINAFGIRSSQSIKMLVACLAGPADPEERNDISLVNKFKDLGVPTENIYMLIETQCIPSIIQACLTNLVKNSRQGDILFLYLGGHGSRLFNHLNQPQYALCTYESLLPSSFILDPLQYLNSDVFTVIDSCYSGPVSYTHLTLPTK
jgi:hypothetical protein